VDPEPTRARKLLCGVAVAVFAGLMWWIVEVRSAPPPPPKVMMPGVSLAP
jgi:hypothetical protein